MILKNSYGLTSIIILSSFIVIFIFHIGAININTNTQPYIIPEDCDFNSVVQGGFGRDGWGINQSNQCSPEITGYDYAGIVINAPKELIFSSQITEDNENALPLCGTYAHALGSYVSDKKRLINSIVFVVVDTKTNESWSGTIPEKQNLIAQPIPKSGVRKPLTNEELKGRTIGGYFNPNLFNIITMPLRETEYIIYATIGPYKSNVVTINAIKRK